MELCVYVLLMLMGLLGMSSGQDKVALLIIDVQTCFTSNGTLPVAGGDDVIDVINGIRATHGHNFELVVHSQDWHCADHVSFASQHHSYTVYQQVNLTYSPNGQLCVSPEIQSSYAINCSQVEYTVSQSLWPDHCVIDTADANFHPSLRVDATDKIVRKGYTCYIDSYSAFYDNGGFAQTELQDLLRNNSITTVFVTGLARDFCVYYTALHAKNLGFNTYVVWDATKPVSESGGQTAVSDMISKGITVLNSTEVGAALGQLINSQPSTSCGSSSLLLTAALALTLWLAFTC